MGGRDRYGTANAEDVHKLEHSDHESVSKESSSFDCFPSCGRLRSNTPQNRRAGENNPTQGVCFHELLEYRRVN